MKRIFTYFLFTAIGSFLLNITIAQNCTNVASGSGTTITCIQGVTEDFDDGGLNGFSGDPIWENPGSSLQTSPSGSPQTGFTASLTTPTYLVNNNLANIRFITGLSSISSFDIYVISDVNQPFGTLLCSGLTMNNIQGNDNLACYQLDLSTYVGQRVRFRIVFHTNNSGKLRFDDFGISIPEAISLPVNFHAFEARKAGNGTILTWKVGQEESLSHYEIEKSNTGRGFAVIGTVPATGLVMYNFTDQQSIGSQVFYRVKSVDLDGKFKYSPIVSLRNGKSTIMLKAFPMPARNSVTIEHEPVKNNGLITISSADGRTIKSIQPAQGSIQTEINIAELKTGMYLIRYNDGSGQVETIKLLKQ